MATPEENVQKVWQSIRKIQLTYEAFKNAKVSITAEREYPLETEQLDTLKADCIQECDVIDTAIAELRAAVSGE